MSRTPAPSAPARAGRRPSGAKGVRAAAGALRTGAGALLTVAAAVLVVALIVEVIGDAVALELGPAARPDAIAARRAQLGLDRPLAARALTRALALITGELGTSTTTGRPVTAVIAERLWPTLAYAVPGFLLASAAAVAAGLHAAWYGDRWDARAIAGGAAFGASVSSVVLVALGVGLLAGVVVPATGWPPAGSGRPLLPHLLLPALLWALIQGPADLRLAITELDRVVAAPWVAASAERGLSTLTLAGRVLRAAAGPLLARVAQRLPYLLTGSVVIERALAIPGIGELVVEALRTRDAPVLSGLTLALALATWAANRAARRLGERLHPRDPNGGPATAVPAATATSGGLAP